MANENIFPIVEEYSQPIIAVTDPLAANIDPVVCSSCCKGGCPPAGQ